MSKRRSPGEIVWKKENAGFIGEPGLIEIFGDDGSESCMMQCGDEDCQEWDTCYQVDAKGNRLGGIACHVSECQMEDRPR